MSRQAFLIRLIRLVILAGAATVLPVNAATQTGPDGVQSSLLPTFDVVSIRPMKEGDDTPTHISNSTHNGYIKAVNVNVKALLEVAYDIPDTRMFGGPAWLTTEKFSLQAQAEPEVDEQIAGLSPEKAKQLKRKMLAALLTERFKLAVHTETREMPVYAMVNARGGPKLGGIKPSDDALPAGNDSIEIRAGNDSLEILAYELSWRLGRPVLDRTALQDRQALRLRWQDDDGAIVDSNAPSLFTAIQEQLGLKLESTKALVPVLVIDHAERPTENE